MKVVTDFSSQRTDAFKRLFREAGVLVINDALLTFEEKYFQIQSFYIRFHKTLRTECYEIS